jgi:hypothetical protein
MMFELIPCTYMIANAKFSEFCQLGPDDWSCDTSTAITVKVPAWVLAEASKMAYPNHLIPTRKSIPPVSILPSRWIRA